jgi:uncharacterized membrane protein
MVMPKLDPSGGLKDFQDSYEWFLSGFVTYMFYIYGLSIMWNLGWRFDMLRLLAPVIGILFVGIGYMLDIAKFNWFVGIRTPWTLSSEVVWDRTHRLGGKLFKICGIFALLGIFTKGWIALFLLIVPILGASAYLIYYSYSEYHKQA